MTQPLPASPFLLIIGPKPTDELYEQLLRNLQDNGLPPDIDVRRETIGTWQAAVIDGGFQGCADTERNRLQTELANSLYAYPGYPAAILLPVSVWDTERTQYMCQRIIIAHIHERKDAPAVVFYKQTARNRIEGPLLEQPITV